MTKCECGFVFETRPGEFRNFNLEIYENKEVWICPKCNTKYVYKPAR